jgi:hypothetical protein
MWVMPMNLVDCWNFGRHFCERPFGNLGSKTESLLPVLHDLSTQLRLAVELIMAHAEIAMLKEEPKLERKNLHFQC